MGLLDSNFNPSIDWSAANSPSPLNALGFATGNFGKGTGPVPNFDFSPTKDQDKQAFFQGLARMGAAILSNNHRGNISGALGAGINGALDGYQGGLDKAQQDNMSRFQKEAMATDWQGKQDDRNRQLALRKSLQSLDQNSPEFYQQAAQLYMQNGDIDNAAKLTEMSQGGKRFGSTVIGDDGQVYQVGAHGLIPTGVSSKPELQFVPGDGYRPAGFADKKTGTFMPVPTGEPQAPQDPTAPWKNLPPKQADEMKQRIYMAANKQLDDIRSQVQTGRQTMADLNQLLQLNQQTATGGLTDKMLPNGWTLNGDKQQINAIVSRLAPQVRPAGSGSTSDKDMALYLRALPGIDKPGDVNQAIVKQYGSNLDQAQKKLAFMENYLQQKGHLNGAEQAWANGGKMPSAGVADTSSIPSAAADYLRRNYKLNRSLAAQFDAKYGQGAAQSILGQ